MSTFYKSIKYTHTVIRQQLGQAKIWKCRVGLLTPSHLWV